MCMHVYEIRNDKSSQKWVYIFEIRIGKSGQKWVCTFREFVLTKGNQKV